MALALAAALCVGWLGGPPEELCNPIQFAHTLATTGSCVWSLQLRGSSYSDLWADVAVLGRVDDEFGIGERDTEHCYRSTATQIQLFLLQNGREIRALSCKDQGIEVVSSSADCSRSTAQCTTPSTPGSLAGADVSAGCCEQLAHGAQACIDGALESCWSAEPLSSSCEWLSARADAFCSGECARLQDAHRAFATADMQELCFGPMVEAEELSSVCCKRLNDALRECDTVEHRRCLIIACWLR